VQTDCGSVETRLAIYPNPAQSRVYISSNKVISKIQLMTMQGQLISQHTTGQVQPGNYALQLNDRMRRGLYVVQAFFADGTVQYSKLIKE
jgi:hypothetical protein